MFLALIHVHRGAECEGVEQAGGDSKSALRVGKGDKDRVVGGMTGLCGVKFVEPGIEFLPPLAHGERRIVSNIVAAAHEGINCAQSTPLALRKHKKSVIKILRARTRDAATD